MKKLALIAICSIIFSQTIHAETIQTAQNGAPAISVAKAAEKQTSKNVVPTSNNPNASPLSLATNRRIERRDRIRLFTAEVQNAFEGDLNRVAQPIIRVSVQADGTANIYLEDPQNSRRFGIDAYLRNYTSTYDPETRTIRFTATAAPDTQGYFSYVRYDKEWTLSFERHGGDMVLSHAHVETLHYDYGTPLIYDYTFSKKGLLLVATQQSLPGNELNLVDNRTQYSYKFVNGKYRATEIKSHFKEEENLDGGGVNYSSERTIAEFIHYDREGNEVLNVVKSKTISKDNYFPDVRINHSTSYTKYIPGEIDRYGNKVKEISVLIINPPLDFFNSIHSVRDWKKIEELRNSDDYICSYDKYSNQYYCREIGS